MPTEERRKKLMADGHAWGDRPDRPRRSAHVVDSEPRESEKSDGNNLPLACNCDSREVLKNFKKIDIMNHVDAPASTVGRISTQGWSLDEILKKSKCFRPVHRVSFKEASKAIKKFDNDGIPLIIEGLHKEPNWLKDDFNPAWLMDHGPENIDVRNVHTWSDKSIPLNAFIQQCRSAPIFASTEEQERLYGKDVECPKEWEKWLHESGVVPPYLTPKHEENLMIRSLDRVETLMCYIGIGDTFTPCHKDLCGSSGQNLMCYTEKDGSSYWFMTRSAAASEASRYFQTLKQELDHENYVITIDQLADAPFDVFVAEQKLGDLVLVPPRSCHQVVNYGGITIKTSWSRMTLKGLETAYYHELPIYQRVCRPEIYRVKSTIFHVLQQTCRLLEAQTSELKRDKKSAKAFLVSTLGAELRKKAQTSLDLFDSILFEECPPPNHKPRCLQQTLSPPLSPGSGETSLNGFTCDFCGADIFQGFFECLDCVPSNDPRAHDDGFMICAGCYIEGRSCLCGNMVPIQCRPFQDLVAVRDKVANLLSTPRPKFTALDRGTGTFWAACLLQKIRKNPRKDQMTCSTTVTRSSHILPHHWVLNCKKCHRGRCFTHILTSQKLHAVDALLKHVSDPTHEDYHRRHGNSVQKYHDGQETFLRAQQFGTKPDLAQQRVYLAEQYQTCKPINSRFMQAGWYDVHIQISPVVQDEDDTALTQDIQAPLIDVLPPLSSLTENDSPVATQSPNRTAISVLSSSSSLKRKRDVFDCVEVPTRSYKIKSSQRITRPVDSESTTSSIDAAGTKLVSERRQIDTARSPLITARALNRTSTPSMLPIPSPPTSPSIQRHTKPSKRRRHLPSPPATSNSPSISSSSTRPEHLPSSSSVTMDFLSPDGSASPLVTVTDPPSALSKSCGLPRKSQVPGKKTPRLLKRTAPEPHLDQSSSSSTPRRPLPLTSSGEILNNAANWNQSTVNAKNTDRSVIDPSTSPSTDQEHGSTSSLVTTDPSPDRRSSSPLEATFSTSSESRIRNLPPITKVSPKKIPRQTKHTALEPRTYPSSSSSTVSPRSTPSSSLVTTDAPFSGPTLSTSRNNIGIHLRKSEVPEAPGQPEHTPEPFSDRPSSSAAASSGSAPSNTASLLEIHANAANQNQSAMDIDSINDGRPTSSSTQSQPVPPSSSPNEVHQLVRDIVLQTLTQAMQTPYIQPQPPPQTLESILLATFANRLFSPYMSSLAWQPFTNQQQQQQQQQYLPTPREWSGYDRDYHQHHYNVHSYPSAPVFDDGSRMANHRRQEYRENYNRTYDQRARTHHPSFSYTQERSSHRDNRYQSQPHNSLENRRSSYNRPAIYDRPSHSGSQNRYRGSGHTRWTEAADPTHVSRPSVSVPESANLDGRNGLRGSDEREAPPLPSERLPRLGEHSTFASASAITIQDQGSEAAVIQLSDTARENGPQARPSEPSLSSVNMSLRAEYNNSRPSSPVESYWEDTYIKDSEMAENAPVASPAPQHPQETQILDTMSCGKNLVIHINIQSWIDDHDADNPWT